MKKFVPGWPALVAVGLSAILSGPVAAHDHGYRPDFDPSLYKALPASSRSEVAVLASPYIGSILRRIDPAQTELLLQKLEAWRPTVVATESLSGLQCDALRRHPFKYRMTVSEFCFDPREAGDAIGLDVRAANLKAERLLADLPAEPSPAQRRRLAVTFLAGGEPRSAAVQWLRLKTDERKAQDGLTPSLVEELNRRISPQHEAYLLGAALAARLGHERVISIDDQSAPMDWLKDMAYFAALLKARDNAAARQRLAARHQAHDRLGSPEGVLEMYREYNAPGQALLTWQSEIRAALTEPSAEAYGKRFVGYWETRNLRIAGNIRDALAAAPGARMLVIIGASHKGYVEAYLNLMHDVQLTDTAALLK